MTQKRKWKIAANLLIVLTTAVGMLMMFFWSYGTLLAHGFANFRYFTVLSNTFGGLTALLWLICEASGVKGRAERVIALLKFAAAVSLGLTFITVMVFLSPLYGYINMLKSANFFFHLITPLVAMAEFVLLNEHRMKMADCVVSMTPMLLYSLVYLIYNLVMGRGENPFQYDWYGFLLWGWGVGAGILAAICGVTFLLGALLRMCNNRVLRHANDGH